MLVLTHSGGTYAPLLCCSLFKGFTSSIFVVTSELDTQAARAVRTGSAPSISTASTSSADANGDANSGPFLELDSQYVFSTHAGFRPAEACSLSVVAMHHLLSHLLIFAMGYLSHFEHGESATSICGSAYDFEEVRELAALSRLQAGALRGIVGEERLGDTPTSAALTKQGRRWAQHVLEGPLAWLLSVAYIAATVLLATTPLSAAVSAALGRSLPTPQLSPQLPPPPSNLSASAAAAADEVEPPWLWAVRYAVAILDVAIYSFLGWWTTVVIRLVQRRPWLHRVAGRSVLIGDVPWVAQSAEAFASKLFALSYSIASCNFTSANPMDHLVHRHTHRVVRGSLLAVGRPDGRVNALTTAEAACALSVSQASSIQNLGVTCESMTVGHSLFALPLSSGHIALPTERPKFMCEVLRGLEGEATPGSSVHPPSVHDGGRRGANFSTPHTSHHGGNAVSIDVETLSGGAPRLRPSWSASRSLDRSLDASEHGTSEHGGWRALDALNQAASHFSTHAGNLFGREHSHEASATSHERGFISHASLLERLALAGMPTEHSELDRSQHSVHMGRRNSGSSSQHGGSHHAGSHHAGSSYHVGSQHAGPHASSTRIRPEGSGSRGRDAQKFFANVVKGASFTNLTRVTGEATEPLFQPIEQLAQDTDGTASAEAQLATSSSPQAAMRPSSPPPSPPPQNTPGSPDVRASKVEPRERRNSLGARAATFALGVDEPGKRMSVLEDSPNAMKATLSRLGKRNRKLFDRAAGIVNPSSLLAFKNSVFEIAPMAEPFLGAWMTHKLKYSKLSTDDLMRRQRLVQLLSETRFDALQRLVSFFVIFHRMGKTVADWWPRASLGLLRYDISRSQSIMRVATTASPVSGMEVRERMLAIQAETRRAQAASSVQRIWRAVRLKRWVSQGLKRNTKDLGLTWFSA